jgi:hypothetical protein
VTTTTVETCITIPREPTTTTVIAPSTITPTAENTEDPCVVVTTVPGTIVLTGATTTSPGIPPSTTTTRLPLTGGGTEPSGRTIALILITGVALLVLSRRQLRRPVMEQDPS